MFPFFLDWYQRALSVRQFSEAIPVSIWRSSGVLPSAYSTPPFTAPLVRQNFLRSDTFREKTGIGQAENEHVRFDGVESGGVRGRIEQAWGERGRARVSRQCEIRRAENERERSGNAESDGRGRARATRGNALRLRGGAARGREAARLPGVTTFEAYAFSRG